MPTIRVCPRDGSEPFEFELTDLQFAQLQAIADARGLTLDDAIALAIRRFMDKHPVFKDRHKVQ